MYKFSVPSRPRWEVLKLFDSKWSVWLGGVERWLLPSTLSHEEAREIERMLNAIGQMRTDLVGQGVLEHQGGYYPEDWVRL